MVIGEKFAWGHLPKTAGNATFGMFRLFPELVVFADPTNTQAKHSSFGEREDQVAGKLLVLNIRRLPAWMLSWAQHQVRMGFKKGEPRQMFSPYEMANRQRADRTLLGLTNGGRFEIGRWLRQEHLAGDFLDFVSGYTSVNEEQRREVIELGRRNAFNYDHRVAHWFTDEHVRMMYENNPLWAETERQVYGDLLDAAALERIGRES
jgi:hypothetical protein